jgi:hypothetical protein
MSRESRMLGGILLVVLPRCYGGLSLLSFSTNNTPGYTDPRRHSTNWLIQIIAYDCVRIIWFQT